METGCKTALLSHYAYDVVFAFVFSAFSIYQAYTHTHFVLYREVYCHYVWKSCSVYLIYVVGISMWVYVWCITHIVYDKDLNELVVTSSAYIWKFISSKYVLH